MQKNSYDNPFNTRYSSKEMQLLFSPDTKYKIWRKLRGYLAEAEMEMKLPIKQE
ncbi:MAG: hypothetical protein PHC69_00520 [Ruminiclostridium sp.]|nr:hypothetical protein [Ruminiclostridium sp.]